MVLMNLFAGQQWRNRENDLETWGKGKRGQSETDGKSNMETYNTICKTDSQWDLLYDSGNSNRGSVTI